MKEEVLDSRNGCWRNSKSCGESGCHTVWLGNWHRCRR